MKKINNQPININDFIEKIYNDKKNFDSKLLFKASKMNTLDDTVKKAQLILNQLKDKKK